MLHLYWKKIYLEFDIEVKSPYMLMIANVNKELWCDIPSKEKDKKGLNKLNILRSEISGYSC